jgi:tetratricopeptide (TPR) repeat protein
MTDCANKMATNHTTHRKTLPRRSGAEDAVEDIYGRKSLRRLLRAWHNPAELNAHPLARSPIVAQRRQARGEDAPTALRGIVLEAIARLRPAGAPTTPPDRAWRGYIALTEHYLEGRALEDVARMLCVEAVSCRRALQQALDALGDLLRRADAPSPAGPLNTAPAPHGPFVGRQALLELADSLLTFGCRRLAFHGLPGSGKSALLAHLASAPFLRKHYPDGVLWATLGPQPDLSAILTEWGQALGVGLHDLEHSKTPHQGAQIVRQALGTRRLALALNDVWDMAHVEPLLVGNAQCVYLLSTTLPELAVNFAEARGCIAIPDLSLEDSLLLLDNLAPGLLADHYDDMRALAEACGGLPLALTLVGHYLRHESHAGQPRRVAAALKALRDAKARLALRLPLGTDRLTAGNASLSESIALSVSILPEAHRQGLLALCELPAKPAVFDEETALSVLRAVIADTPSALATLDRLVDSGLIQHDNGSYSIHAAIRDWRLVEPHAAQAHISERARRALVEHTMRVVYSPAQCPLTPAQWTAALTAAQISVDLDWPEAAAHFCQTLFDCLDRRGVRALAERLLNVAERQLHLHGPAERCQLDIQRGRVLLWHHDVAGAIAQLQQTVEYARSEAPQALPTALATLAQAHWLAGNARQTVEICDQALDLTPSPDQAALRLQILHTRTAALGQLGRHDEVESTLVQSASLAHALGQPVAEINALLNLGALLRQRNDHDEASRHLQAGLALARQIDFRDRIAYALIALGVIAVDKHDYAQAQAYYEEARAIAHDLASLHNLTLVEHALGVLNMRQKRWEQAHSHLLQALQLAEQNRLTWHKASVRVELGECCLAQGQIAEAGAIFAHGLEIAGQNYYPDLAALHRFGLARVQAYQGDWVEAGRLAQLSLSDLRTLEHYRADEVAGWLEALQHPETRQPHAVLPNSEPSTPA